MGKMSVTTVSPRLAAPVGNRKGEHVQLQSVRGLMNARRMKSVLDQESAAVSQDSLVLIAIHHVLTSIGAQTVKRGVPAIPMGDVME